LTFAITDICTLQWRNFFGLAGVVAGVMLPVVLRYYWRDVLAEAATTDEASSGPIRLDANHPDPIQIVRGSTPTTNQAVKDDYHIEGCDEEESVKRSDMDAAGTDSNSGSGIALPLLSAASLNHSTSNGPAA
jgi:hypothetical protein